jgi:hypothetical protein
MTNAQDRRRAAYQDATSLSQSMLDETFRGGETQIEAIGVITKTVSATTYTIRFADRPKYVGNNFYEGRASFPIVQRTIGDPLSPSIKFSQVEIRLANMDGFYNDYLESGDTYINWIGARLQLSMGLRDVSASFITVFDGFVPEDDGSDVTRESIIIRATDRFNDLNRRPGLPYINVTDFPSAPADVLGKIIPMVLGKWTVGFTVTDDTGTVDITDTGISKQVNTGSPTGFYGGVPGYYVGGGYFVFSIGSYTPDTIDAVYIKRGSTFLQCNFTATPANTAGYWSVEVTSLDGVLGTVPYIYQTGDVAAISVDVPYDTGKYSNVIELAREILYTLGGKVDADLNEDSWDDLAAKATPAQSDFTSLEGRLWIGDEKSTVLALTLGLLEQVRVEMFIDADGLIKVQGLHPEDFPDPDDMDRIDQVELDENRVDRKADDKTFFNQGWINYGYTPLTGKTELSTVQKKNQTSIDKSGKTVIKVIDCPNLYVAADAEYQLIEFLRLYSAGLSFITVDLCWVHLLRDLGQFMRFNYSIGGFQYRDKPTMVREINLNLATASVQMKLLSLANFPYADYSPSNSARMLSSASQSITNV